LGTVVFGLITLLLSFLNLVIYSSIDGTLNKGDNSLMWILSLRCF